MEQRQEDENGINGGEEDVRVDTKVVARQSNGVNGDSKHKQVHGIIIESGLTEMIASDSSLMTDLYLMAAFREHLRPPLTKYMVKLHQHLKDREIAFHHRIDDRNGRLGDVYNARYAARAAVATSKANDSIRIRALAEKAFRHQTKPTAGNSRPKVKKGSKRAAALTASAALNQKKANEHALAAGPSASSKEPQMVQPRVASEEVNRPKESMTKAEKRSLAKLRVTQNAAPSAAESSTGPDPFNQLRSNEEIQEISARLHQQIAKVHVGKIYRSALAGLQNRYSFARRLSGVAAREQRRAMTKSAKFTKDVQSKAKKAMREMLMFWKQNEREERDLRKKAEKEALDRAKHEEEQREAKRQARKLNFLITQTELYSHFIGKKIRTDEAEESADTAPAEKDVSAEKLAVPSEEGGQAPENLQELDFDDDDESNLRRHAERNAQNAVDLARQRAEDFDQAAKDAQKDLPLEEASFEADDLNFQNPTTMGSTLEVSQPKMLQCELKEYQLKGLNWLANLYEQGINGILADEMGLGKTVQSISLMAYLAEHHDIWGPFLVIAPASTLHNWQQEIARFVPSLKALPYWGNAKDRMILRKFWNRRQMKYTRDAPFHVLVTSYQLVVSDERYFQRVKWQYMVLDEAQAIKSSTSARWKTLLGFHCRNRLLLTGTPIQNSMQELWALLHFIMPSLFDSHDEFSDWFSKDIENHAENKGSLNEHQLRRLHMILKPFMLRRIKKNVQNELGDKIELDVFCGLTPRQRALYHALRSKVSLKDILEKASSMSEDESMSTLLNLVMQFRKVCNHPDLFERADVEAPFVFGNRNSTPASLIAKETDLLEVGAKSASFLTINLCGLYNDPHLGFSNGFGRLPSWFQRHCNIASEIASNNGHEIGQRLRSTDLRGPCLDIEALILQKLRSEATSQMKTSIEAIDVGNQMRSTLTQLYLPKALAPPPALVARGPASKYIRAVEHRDQIVNRAIVGMPQASFDDPAAVDSFVSINPTLRPEGLWSDSIRPSFMKVPAMMQLMSDSGKLARLDALLRELKQGDHRVLIYFQMTRMIDLMEEYLAYRQYKYLRLDGSSKISDRRDMVMDWQTRPDIFIFLLSTRAGGLGINLTAADTVIFYDSDWNPTVDQQAMDRAHRLGQTRQVTVYRLITRGTIEERIRLRAKQKDEIQKIVISGGEYKQSVEFTRQRELASLLFDDDEIAESMSTPQAQVTGGTKDTMKGNDTIKARSSKQISSSSGKKGAPPRSLESMWHENEPWFEEAASGNIEPPSAGAPSHSKNPTKSHKRKGDKLEANPPKAKKIPKTSSKKEVSIKEGIDDKNEDFE